LRKLQCGEENSFGIKTNAEILVKSLPYISKLYKMNERVIWKRTGGDKFGQKKIHTTRGNKNYFRFCREEAKNVRERKTKKCSDLFPGLPPLPLNITIKTFGPDNYPGFNFVCCLCIC